MAVTARAIAARGPGKQGEPSGEAPTALHGLNGGGRLSTSDPRGPPGFPSLEGTALSTQSPSCQHPRGRRDWARSLSRARLNTFGGAGAWPPDPSPGLPKREEPSRLFPSRSLPAPALPPHTEPTLPRRNVKNNQHLKGFATGGSSPGPIRIS